MAGLTRRSSERCRARRILRQQAPASVSKRGFIAFYALLAFYFVILQEAAGRDVCVSNELQQQNRAMSLSRALAFVSKLGSWKRNVTPTCLRGAQQGDRQVRRPLSRPSHTNVSTHTWSPPCWLVSLFKVVINTAAITFNSDSNKVWKRETSSFMTESPAHSRAQPWSFHKSRVQKHSSILFSHKDIH